MGKTGTSRGPWEPRTKAEKLSGAIWVENGQFFVRNPVVRSAQEHGRFAVLIKHKEIPLWVDGKLVEHPEIVVEGSKIDYALPSIMPEITMQVIVSDDAMEAYLQIDVVNGVEYILPDQGPAQVMDVTVEKILTEPEGWPTVAEVQAAATQAGVRVPLWMLRVNAALEEGKPGRWLIAKGKPAVDGQDERLKFFGQRGFSPLDAPPGGAPAETTEGVPTAQDDGSPRKDVVDFRDRGVIPSVGPGQVVAIKIRRSEGQVGYDVRGNVLEARQGKRLEIKAGFGIRELNDGYRYVATLWGRPVWQPIAKVLVIQPHYEHKGDVDMQSGNVVFHGDVTVYGNVAQGFVVQADGMVLIHGSVFGGLVKAGSHITVRGHSLGALVEAGGESARCNHLILLLVPIRDIVRDCIDAIKLLEKNNAFSVKDLQQSGIGPLLKMLVEVKYKELPHLVYRIDEYLYRELSTDTVHTLVETIRHSLLGLGPLRFRRLEELEHFHEAIQQVMASLAAMVTEVAHITLNETQSSRIEATGTITVHGKGVIQSELLAGRDIVIQGTCRGGRIIARGSIHAAEVGAEAEVPTEVTIGTEGALQADHLWPNVTLHMERFRLKNMVHRQHILFVNDPERGPVIR
ncbi:DUF342 domain-containing protein [Heliophilum fasciatum]|uniref:Uncharacterized protein DUF342 n=1 Tax=Heliophilum fasciatum TaxID=35700 RepID=A0A4R2RNX5_9FIRM|nr:FapA family protein [Heliophilum fasciatum]MCW2277778.1 uncharacterized protein (DUF342 family) [Heliophilum fasciatum]TCP64728.1 uncharacterized protein DUF342 [Heliophilum fasciatum]